MAACARRRPRPVAVSLGEATLVIADAEGRALSHWSLPAVERLPPPSAHGPARFAPGVGADEILEVADAEMVEAIERVRRAVARRAPRRRPAWRRLALATALLVGLGALAAALPDLLLTHALRVVPFEARAALGEAVLERLGAPCDGADGLAALDRWAERMAPGLASEAGPARIAVLAEGLDGAVALPGGIVALPAATIERAAEPDAAAGRLLAAAEGVGDTGVGPDPLEALLRDAGPRETLRLLTAAAVSDAALDAYAARLAARPAPGAPEAERLPGLLSRFEAAGVSSAPYGRAVRTPALVDLDTHPGAAPSLADAEWIALQGVCED